MPVALWLTLESLISVGGDRFPGGQEVYLHLLKVTGGEAESLMLLFL